MAPGEHTNYFKHGYKNNHHEPEILRVLSSGLGGGYQQIHPPFRERQTLGPGILHVSAEYPGLIGANWLPYCNR